jgi:hypothetical protein
MPLFPARVNGQERFYLMTSIPDKNGPSNPYQATTIGNLITSNQLHWLTIAAESVGMDKEQTALALFNCSVYSLSRDAARQLEQYFAQVKMAAHQKHNHEHDCGACGDTFGCSQSLCHAELTRFCDGCKADLFDMASPDEGRAA